MAQIRFQGPECGMGDHEVGPMAETEIYCVVCLARGARTRHPPPLLGGRTGSGALCARTCSPPEQRSPGVWLPLFFRGALSAFRPAAGVRSAALPGVGRYVLTAISCPLGLVGCLSDRAGD